jgi:hypothetical protein
MAPDLRAVIAAVVCALVPLFMNGLIVYQSWRVVGGHLERNPYFGIRTPSTIKNDEAWMAAHRAALRLTPWLVLGIVATWAGLWAAALSESTIIVILVGIVGLIAALALTIYTVVIASRAARAADSWDDSSSVTRRAYASGAALPGPVLSERTTKTLGLVVAAAAFTLTVILLISIVHGYVSATHHQLPPNSSFGFRDATTYSSLPAWYAAQEAGFQWLLFAGGPILVANALFSVAVAVRRRPPWDVLALSLACVVLLGIVVVIAGVHADGIARAVVG